MITYSSGAIQCQEILAVSVEDHRKYNVEVISKVSFLQCTKKMVVLLSLSSCICDWKYLMDSTHASIQCMHQLHLS